MPTALPRSVASWIIGLVLAASVSTARPAHAGNAGLPPIDSENLFGFITGTDVGEAGEKELESETTGRLGRGTGTHAALPPIARPQNFPHPPPPPRADGLSRRP